MKRYVWITTGLILGVATAVGVVAATSPQTPEATRPRVVPVSTATQSRIMAEGRVVTYPGAEVIVGTDFPGTIMKLLVEERQRVKKGDLIAEINASPERAALEEAKARVTEAQADTRLADFEKNRSEKLLANKVGSQQALDKAMRDLDAAQARKSTAEAEVKRLAALIAKASILAPVGGTVISRHSHAGETIDRGARIVTIADLDRLRVEAEVDEFDTSRIEPGMTAVIRAEGEKDRSYTGVVEEIPDTVTGRRIKPQDPGRPSDTRVLLVKIALKDKTPLKLGRRVEVEIHSNKS